MALFDKIGQKTAGELQQYLLGALNRLKEIVQELRDETKILIAIEFEKKPKKDQP